MDTRSWSFLRQNKTRNIYISGLCVLFAAMFFSFQNFSAEGSASLSRAQMLLAGPVTNTHSNAKAAAPPIVLGPVDLNCVNKPCQGVTVTVNALGSGTNGPATAQAGLLLNVSKDNWWTGGAVGEVDGLDITLRQNSATSPSDSSGILINVQNQGNGFLSATEFVSSIVNPVTNTITREIDVQEGVLDALTGDYDGAVYNGDIGALGTGVLIQNTSPNASWAYALQYINNSNVLFSVDGAGNISGSSLQTPGVNLNGDPRNGSVDVGNLGNNVATPYLNLNGFGTSNDVRLINDANGQLTINTVTGGSFQVNAQGVFIAGSYHINLATPSSSSAPCTPGQIGADQNNIYICVATNTWRRSALSAF